MGSSALNLAQTMRPLHTLWQQSLCAPFDVAREQYAAAVRSGLAPRSLLASARNERALVAMEKISLGPLARTR